MNLVTMRNYCADLLDDPSFGYFTVANMNVRLNLAAKELQKRLISANESYCTICVKTQTVSGQQVYLLPTDFIQVIRLELVTGGFAPNQTTQKLEAITPNQRDLVQGGQGQPYYYYFQKNYIYLWPVPQAAQEMHLEYSSYIPDMVLDTDSPDLPQQFHEYVPIIATRDMMIKDSRPLTSLDQKLAAYEMLMKQVAVQRHADQARMVTATSWEY